ncbi:MAG: class F sortase [Actinomycetota bacterium]
MSAVGGARTRFGRRRGGLLLAGLLGLAACGADPIDTTASGPGMTLAAPEADTVADPEPLEPPPVTGPLELISNTTPVRTSGVPVALDAVPIESARFDDTDYPAVPVGLRIEGLDVEAPIILAGVEDNGEMELPGATEAAWYRHGPLPGADEGSAVIAAHVDWTGRPGPFFGLRDLPTGSLVVVELSDGTEARYRTIETEQYDKVDLPVDDLFRRDGRHSLALVTCGGSFDSSLRSYSDNVVTIAIPV